MNTLTDILKKYKNTSDRFIEISGENTNGINSALEAGFDNVISVLPNRNCSDICESKFSDKIKSDQVRVYWESKRLGRVNLMEELQALKNEEPYLVFLHTNQWKRNETILESLYSELQIILSYSQENTIILDRIFDMDNRSERNIYEEIEHMLKDWNPDYKVVMDTIECWNILVAFV